jgi:hypothetical protein
MAAAGDPGVLHRFSYPAILNVFSWLNSLLFVVIPVMVLRYNYGLAVVVVVDVLMLLMMTATGHRPRIRFCPAFA